MLHHVYKVAEIKINSQPDFVYSARLALPLPYKIEIYLLNTSWDPMFHSTRKCSLIKDVKIHSSGYVRQSPGTVCKLSARTVASVDVPIRKLPLLILGLKGLLGKVHNNLLSPSGRPTLSVPAIYACICHQIITILHRNRVSSQIYEQPLGLLR